MKKNLFDIIKHTPFHIKQFDATEYLMEAIEHNNEKWIEEIFVIKEYYKNRFCSNYDIADALEETREEYNNGTNVSIFATTDCSSLQTK